MNSAKIIESFQEQGIILSAKANQLRFHALSGALTAELRQILTENKHAILQHLQALELDVAFRTLFEQPPIAQLAREIDTQLAKILPDWPKDGSPTW